MVTARVSGPARTDDVLDLRNSENSSGQTFLVANSRDEARGQGIRHAMALCMRVLERPFPCHIQSFRFIRLPMLGDVLC
jgi:hypothetical protein